MEKSKRHCFVIGPIGSEDSDPRIHADWLYDGIIGPVFQNHFADFIVERADKISTPGMVNSQIINRLYEAELVIADLSFHNANAFYELAIRYSDGKPIIHMIQKDEQIPFDVVPHRAIQFAVRRARDLEEAQKQLISAVRAASAPGFQADNPILHARGRLQLEHNATPETRVLVNEIELLRSELRKNGFLQAKSVDDLWALHENLTQELSERIVAEKRALEERLRVLVDEPPKTVSKRRRKRTQD
jgi:hypothetical protein